VLCSIKRHAKLQDRGYREKVFSIDQHICMCAAGVSADAGILLKMRRDVAQQHRLKYQEAIPVELLASEVSDDLQFATQYIGRVWGVSLLIAGYDRNRGMQLLRTDPSGNLAAFIATAVGSNSTEISQALTVAMQQGQLRTLNSAIKVAISLLQQYGGDGVIELATTVYDKAKERVDLHVLQDSEVQQLIASVQQQQQ
jgi:20S proteasome alpha/beta subunit